MDFSDLESAYKVKVSTTEDRNLFYITFEDGKKYKFARPGIFETYSRGWDTTTPHLSLFKLGIERTTAENQETPPLSEAYLEENRDLALGFWAPLYRRLL